MTCRCPAYPTRWTHGSPKQYAKSFEIRAQGDDFDDIRSEYSDILQDQLVNGNNGLMKRKFMTYTIEADSLKMVYLDK